MSLLTQEELSLLQSDSKYKNYASSIEKTLKNFESSSEWADLISSLGKLKKCIQSFPKYQFIPKRVNVCKRLAQCLHPALPSGVHLKALEVYTCIFQNIGTDHLSKDLFLYSSGLFPLLANAALSVKPILLNLYETYFLPLKKSLRPCLTGLLIALLPGLEEGSDFYQRTFNLIKNISLVQSEQSSTTTNINNYIADDKYFYTCLWSAIISQSSIRFPAIQFVLSNYDAKKRNGNLNLDDQLYLIGNSIDLMINALCCCLQDPNPLVQRSILDLICTCLPVDSKHITKGDKIQLIIVAIHVVLRRDMSLNRRIYSWLMGSPSNLDENKVKPKKSDDNYFNIHSKNLLIQSIKMLLNKKETSSILYLLNDDTTLNVNNTTTLAQTSQINHTSPNTNTTLKLLKIVSNLVERQEIGQAIIDDILLDLLFYVYKEYSFLNLNNGSTNSVQSYLKKNSSNFHHVQQHQQSQQNLKESNELKKVTCNFLFQSFQVYFIWEFCANKFELICKNYTNNLINNLQSASSHTIISESNQSSASFLSPAQLCDLYEFILDLQTDSEMYSEIQTEHLPLMLKRIIQTLNNYCENMNNLDLSKSLYLGLKILNKVVPKIVVPDSTIGSHTNQKSGKLSAKTSKAIESEEKIEDVVRDVLNNIVTSVENLDPYFENLEVRLAVKLVESEPDDKFIIEQCLNSLKKLSHSFIQSHLFQQENQQEQIDKSFKCLFNLKFKNSFSNDDGYQSDSSDLNSLSFIKLKSNSLQYLQSFQMLNKLLIKMLFFPREHQEEKLISSEKDSPEDLISTFEDWLKDLFVISTTSQMQNQKFLFEFQSISLNTLIELIHLSESVNSHFSPLRKTTNSDSKCLLQTIFTKKQIDFIFNQSKFGYLTAQMLWSHLSPSTNQLDSYVNCTDKRASILFCLLHELLPNNLCEEIIIKNFLLTQNYNLNSDIYTTCNLNHKIDSFKRFTRLWHWSRELNSKKDTEELEELSVSTIKYGKLNKTFERFLVILFDHVTKDDTPRSLNKIIQDWLMSCITDYNDLARLMDILLVSLVHPSTARVSIQYFINNIINSGNTKQNFNLDEEDSSNSSFESKVYAISNEDGNVKYHVNNNESIKSNQSGNQQQLFMLTSIEQSTQSNKPLKNANIELPLSILNAASLNSGISLRINPFLGDEENEEENSQKNSRLLENYKAIKLKQNGKNPSPLPSPNTSPSLPSISPNPADQSIPSINIEQSNRNSLETNHSEYLSEEDEEDDDLEDDEDYGGFEQSDEEYREDDLDSQNTDMTLLSERSKKYRNSLGNYKKSRKLKIKEKLKKSSSSTLINEKRSKSAEKISQPLIIKNKDLIVDLQNQLDSNFSHLLIYINCNNIQTTQQGNCVLVSSKFSNTSYDHVKVLFVLKCIEQLLIKCSQEFLLAICQTCVSNSTLVYSVHNEKLIDLIMKHMRSIYGENFYLSSTNVANFGLNTMTYLEAITLILLFYIRSYYPPGKFVLKNGNEQIKLSKSNSINSIHSEASMNVEESENLAQFEENRNIQIYCLKILSKIFKELNILMYQSPSKQIHKFATDYLDKLKIQKTLLHLLHSTIHQPTSNSLPNLLLQTNNSIYFKQSQYTYVTEMLNSFENLIELERVLNEYNQSVKYLKSALLTTSSSTVKSPDMDDDFLVSFKTKTPQQSIQTNKYIPSQSIFNQSMFVSSILHYLKNMNLVEYHLDILKLIRSTLPSSLKSISTYVIEQLCRNLLYITNGGMTSGSSSSNYFQPIISYMSQVSLSINIPDIIINLIKQLSYLLNYCLLTNQGSSIGNLTNELNDSQFRALRHVDNDLNLNQAKESLINLFPSILTSLAQVWQRCNLLLSSTAIAHSINEFNALQIGTSQCTWILGHPAVIKQCITELLNPIAQFHSVQFMHAIGSVWGERRKKSRVYQEHKVIIELVRSLKSFPLPVIIQNITDILKQSNANNSKDKKKSPSNIWLLQFLHTYLDFHLASIKTRSNMLNKVLQPNEYSNNGELASCLCTFFKESLSGSATSNFTPACYFQLFRILHDSVNNFPLLVDDKKYSKDLQEATHKLFELCNSIVASSLQQTTWLRKNFAVKLNPQPDLKAQPNGVVNGNVSLTQNSNSNSTPLLPIGSNGMSTNSAINESMSSLNSSKANNSTNTSGVGTSIATSASSYSNSIQTGISNQQASFSDMENEMNSNLSDHGSNLNSIDHLNGFVGDLNDSNNNLVYSLQALNILAEYLAKTLDIVYKSDEKDRLVIPILMSLMSNLWPYLKTHSVANKNNFRAASNLLMTLTIYPYTRKTWKKEVFEMLFDNMYFHVDSVTLEYLKTIIDNLISNDRAMFKDVLTRVTYQQSGGLFTSKEQESEQKAQLLKRLAFVIFSSEKDQYQKNMPEIQECIAHVLKLVQSANLYSTLFLLFRILLLRISSRHLIALWPTIISELILILLQIEQDLTEDNELKNGTKYSNLDHIASQMTTQSWNNSKLQIYLSACKLIDLILTLPCTLTPQFQLYKWSFINTEDTVNLKQKEQFVPYLNKINNLIKLKFPNDKGVNLRPNVSGPLIRQKKIDNLVDLKPFFEQVTTHHFVHNSNQTHTITNQQLQYSLLGTTNLKLFEANVHEDFLEGWIQ